MNRAAALLPLALLAACKTPPGEYPSLAIRPAERATGTLYPVKPYIPPPTPPAVSDRLAQLSAQVASAHAGFERQVPAARAAVNAAHGSAPGADAWSVAQVALAGLESARSQAMIALADFDRLYVDAATQGGELTRIGAARDAANARVSEENATINALVGSLGA